MLQRGKKQMDINQIKESFYMNYQYCENDSNKLLDFMNSQYVNGYISIQEYKACVYLLEGIGAKKAENYFKDNRHTIL